MKNMKMRDIYQTARGSKSTIVCWVWPGVFRDAQNYLNMSYCNLGCSGGFIVSLRNSLELKIKFSGSKSVLLIVLRIIISYGLRDVGVQE